MKKYKVTAVSYLNTKPLLYGLLNHPVFDQMELQTDIPSVCADKLIRNEVDLALVPVAAIPEMESPYILSDYCIGTEGSVKTVCIYAMQPLEELKYIYLDFHSRTSVELVRILLQHHWDLQPELIQGEAGYLNQVQGNTGALVIGDRTIGLEKRFDYAYDLGEAWENFSGLPFVFAAWVSNKPLPQDFIKAFNEALKDGLKHIPELMLLLANPYPDFDLEEYYTQYISYDLDQPKRQALEKFLKYLKQDLQPSIQESLLLVE